jgi:hypothetical protein
MTQELAPRGRSHRHGVASEVLVFLVQTRRTANDNPRGYNHRKRQAYAFKQGEEMKTKTSALIVLILVCSTQGRDEPKVKEPALRRELLAMTKEDQQVRAAVVKQLSEKRLPLDKGAITDPALVKTFAVITAKMTEVDQKNRARLKEMVAQHGWPGATLVGKDGAHAAWLLVQHADNDRPFQKRCLKLMKAAPRGEVDPPDIAYLTDRVLVGENKKQLYGTQLQGEIGAFRPKPIEDEANVDRRRAEVGLPPLAEYLQSSQIAFEKAAGWKSLFDGKSLDGWKQADFGPDGKVSVKDGAIVMDKGKLMSGVTYRQGDFPKMDYEVSLEGKKLAGDDFFCTTTFPVGDNFCSLVVGGWGGRVVGLSSLNSQDASENETTRNKEFKHDQWYRIRIRVTRDRIQSWIDDEQLVDVDTRDKKISIRIECSACKPFGIATWNTAGAVRNIRVRALN